MLIIVIITIIILIIDIIIIVTVIIFIISSSRNSTVSKIIIPKMITIKIKTSQGVFCIVNVVSFFCSSNLLQMLNICFFFVSCFVFLFFFSWECTITRIRFYRLHRIGTEYLQTFSR